MEKTIQNFHSPKEKKQALTGYLYLSPGLIWIILIYVIPVFSIIWMSLTEGHAAGEKINLHNYQLILQDPLFRTAIVNNVKLLLIAPVLTFLSLVFSSLFYQAIRGWRFYQTVIFIPVILSIAAVGIVFNQFLQYYGPFNDFLNFIGLGFLATDWLGNVKTALGSVTAVIVWKELGFGTILFLARLMSIEPEIYEAARIDGAGWFDMLWHITIPELTHVIEFYVVLCIVTAFSSVFDYILIMTNGGPNNSTVVGEFFIYRYAFVFNKMSIASAVAVVYLIVGILLMLLRYQIIKRLEE